MMNIFSSSHWSKCITSLGNNLKVYISDSVNVSPSLSVMMEQSPSERWEMMELDRNRRDHGEGNPELTPESPPLTNVQIVYCSRAPSQGDELGPWVNLSLTCHSLSGWHRTSSVGGWTAFLICTKHCACFQWPPWERWWGGDMGGLDNRLDMKVMKWKDHGLTTHFFPTPTPWPKPM